MGAEPTMQSNVLLLAAQLLASARADLLGLERMQQLDRVFIRRLSEQIHTNTLCWAVADSGFFGRDTRQLDSSAEISIRVLRAQAIRPDGGDHIVGIWQMTAEWLAAKGDERRKKAKELRHFCEKRIPELVLLGREYRALGDLELF